MTARAPTAPRLSTAEDLFAIPEERRRHELIEGVLAEKGAASAEHGAAQRKLSACIDPFDRRPSGSSPGGWWFATEVEIVLDDHDVVRPDVVGWRRERVPERPRGARVTTRPDWVCEILSTNRVQDLVRKKRVYHRHGVPHYWILDPEEGMLTVHRHAPEGYLDVLSAERGERVRAEPFEALELDVGALFGDDEPEPPAAPAP
ncbi:MAG: Uma2 family endonuclease [Polyangiaceae bacterium]|nr:Uma2 family endonuclease [Polyangiaceae bacterium]